MTDRQQGRTTRQMLAAPLGAFYVWPNERIAYPLALAKHLGRQDLRVRPSAWLLTWMLGLAGCPGVVIDHASNPSAEAREQLRWLSTRGTVVQTWRDLT